MKKTIFIILFAIIACTAFAQSGTDVVTVSGFSVNLGTFTGIVALVSVLVTEIFKFIPSIKDTKIAKILISVLSGIVICILAWLFHLTPLLEGIQWWQAFIYGLAAGLSGCGFYDIVKAVNGAIGNNKLKIE